MVLEKQGEWASRGIQPPMSVGEPNTPLPNGVSGEWQGWKTGDVGNRQAHASSPLPLIGDASGPDEKRPPSGGCPPMSIRASKLGPFFLGDAFRIGQRSAISQGYLYRAAGNSQLELSLLPSERRLMRNGRSFGRLHWLKSRIKSVGPVKE